MNARETHKRANARAVKAAELRSSGLTYREIADRLERHTGEGSLSLDVARSLAKKGEVILAKRGKRQ